MSLQVGKGYTSCTANVFIWARNIFQCEVRLSMEFFTLCNANEVQITPINETGWNFGQKKKLGFDTMGKLRLDSS